MFELRGLKQYFSNQIKSVCFPFFYFQLDMTASTWCWMESLITRKRTKEHCRSMLTFNLCHQRRELWPDHQVSLSENFCFTNFIISCKSSFLKMPQIALICVFTKEAGLNDTTKKEFRFRSFLELQIFENKILVSPDPQRQQFNWNLLYFSIKAVLYYSSKATVT